MLIIKTHEYVKTLFLNATADETIALITAIGTENGSVWPARPFNPRSTRVTATHAPMVTFGPARTAAGGVKRTIENAMLAHSVQLDDAGSKGNKTPPVAPSIIIETSPNVFTYIYLLDEPSPVDELRTVLASLKAAGYMDENCATPVHVNRLPGSKPDYKEFEAKLIVYEPDRRFKLSELLGMFEVEEVALESMGDRVLHPAPVGLEVHDEVLDWIDVIEEEADGWVKITCPWAHLHSDNRSIAKYKPATNEDAVRIFHCHHGHEHGPQEFLDWVAEQGGPAVDVNYRFSNATWDEFGDAIGAQPQPVRVIDKPEVFGFYEDIKRRFAHINAAMLPEPTLTAKGVLSAVQSSTPRNVEWLIGAVGATKTLNMMSGATGWRFDFDTPDEAHLHEGIFVQVGMQCGLARGGIEKALENIPAVPFHPMEDWMIQHEWDGHDYLGDLAASLPVAVEGDDYQRYVRAVVKRWFVQGVQAIRGWRGGEVELPYVLVLTGGQGAGKTSWVRSLAPDEFTKEGVRLHLGSGIGGDRDAIRQATSRAIVELGELETTFSKSAQGDLKNFLSSTSNIYRPAYGRHEITVRRCTIFAATANSDSILRDGTGHRRFWPIMLRDGARRSIPRVTTQSGLWAQANALWGAGEPFTLSEDEEALHDRYVVDHEESSEVAERMQEQYPNGFAYPGPGVRIPTGAQVLTTSEICKQIDVRGAKERGEVREYVLKHGGKFGRFTDNTGRNRDHTCIANPPPPFKGLEIVPDGDE